MVRGDTSFIRLLARARTRNETTLMRRRAEQAWRMRWWAILSCAGARAFASGQQGQEPSGFLSPTPPNLARENDQPSPATWSYKLGICSLLPETCRLQHSAIFIRRPGMRRTITVQRRNQRSVDCQLSSHAVDPLDLE